MIRSSSLLPVVPIVLLLAGCGHAGSTESAPASDDAGKTLAGGGDGNGGGDVPNGSADASTGGGDDDGATAGNGAPDAMSPSPPHPTGPTGASCVVPAPTVTTALANGAKVAATVHADHVTCATADDFAGSNFEAFPGWGADVSLSAYQRTAYQTAGLQMFRYPGGEPGEWSDLLFTGTCSDGSKANWGSPSFADLWTFASSAGVGALMLQTNPTTQYCGAGSQDASGAHAAALATAAASKGVNAVFEVGNEPEVSAYFQKNGGENAYVAKFIEHAAAIHAASPNSKVYGPALCGLGGNCSFPTTWDSGWLATFLGATGNLATGAGKGSVDGVSFHVYWHPEWSYSDLAQAKIDKYGFGLYWTQTMMPYLHSTIAKYDNRDLPISITEISLGDGIPGGTAQPQNMFSVLSALDTVGSFAISGLRSFQWFDANAAGPSDFGMITPSATRPIYYAFAAWAKMGRSFFAVDQDASPHDIAIYASARPDGTVTLLLLNKTSSSHDVALTFSGASVAGRTVATTTLEPATAASDASSSILFAGAADPAPSALPAPTTGVATSMPTVTLAAYSATVLAYAP